MTETTTPTLAELMAQQAQLERQIAAASLTGVQAAQAVMDRTSTGKVADDLEALLTDIPAGSQSYQQLFNVINVVRNVKSWLPQEVARLQALAAEPQTQEAA
ncbi:hypothetical protein PMI04_015105 [Sphingobium sp. AP49]|uniref:hypothetical protein n=1 Tax=Sphingobium sp. AP49 TaxID=1144307 RepID=UPI00026ED975|nr:hypothetical protein [Sphingobium sp. AP49]WHO37888.1 hypothetical protein PMI04_015105 [Sphingobium sp. AP49]